MLPDVKVAALASVRTTTTCGRTVKVALPVFARTALQSDKRPTQRRRGGSKPQARYVSVPHRSN